MNEKEQLKIIKNIELNISIFEQVMEHFKKTNWLHVKDYIEIINKAKHENVRISESAKRKSS